MVEARELEVDPLLRYIERFTTVLVARGFPAMPARVFVALLVSESDRLTAADLAEMLRISPAAVSGAVRYLIDLGIVHKERVPGSRRDYYRMPPDVWSDLMRSQTQVFVRWSSLLKEGIDLVGADTPAGGRLSAHAAFMDFLNAQVDGMLERWETVNQGR